ncbi:hypothetical protein N9L18_01330 [Candidatus Pacebacteria bacterium]|nr:hypothetical protein [Candidatus Paceibacterota bacterium]
MMMIYQKTNKRKSGSKRKWTISFLVIVFILIAINVSGVLFPQSVARNISSPFIKIKEAVLSPMSGTLSYFSSKKSLSKENEELKQNVSALEFRLLKEQLRLKDDEDEIEESELSPDGEQVRVLIRPPFSPYDTFVISNNYNGQDVSIEVGDRVFLLGAYIGNVESINSDSAIVKLKSSSGEKTVVRVGDIDGEAVGKGGGRFTITLPKDLEVEIGDIVTVPSLGPVIIGLITEIEESEAGSFNTLHFSLPVSVSNASFVTIVKN